ncbi:MAG: VWA domain-containing protein [Planctomycetes bacterium]|nr:VWA domain-containing protein [Planctomycetota bacterium]MCW8136703.1 VWA domain-containing protein [Planctomycetota bacterium]
MKRLILATAVCCLLAACDAPGNNNGNSGGGGGGGTPLQIITTALASTQVGVNYQATISATGGSGAGYTWSVVSGAMPLGFGLIDGTPDATISGVPNLPGSYSFTLQVQDSLGATATQALQLDVIGYYSQPVGGKFMFVLDRSSAMAGARHTTMVNSVTAVIQQLTDNDEFDIATFNGSVTYLWGSLMPATTGNVAVALSWLNATTTGGVSDSGNALQTVCAAMPTDLDRMFLYIADNPGGSMTAVQVLTDFPAWWQPFSHCDLVVLNLGGGAVASFGQQLAALAGGSYLAI